MDLSPRADQDRLSALPDDILVSILEKLGSARDAMRVRVLSRRWANLPFLLPEPEISVTEFLPVETQFHKVRSAQLSRAMESFRGAVASFVSIADPTTPAASARCLRLDFVLADGCTSILEQRRLPGDQVRALQLAIRTTVHQTDCDEALMRRYARRFDRFFNPGLFRLLTRLELSNLWFGSDDVAALLGACPRLERLELSHCHRLREELVVAAPPALTELVLYMCFYTRVVLRSAPNLTRLACDLWISVAAPLSLHHVPRLETLRLANPKAPLSKHFRLSELLTDVTSLRCLYLDFKTQEVWQYLYTIFV